MFRLDALPQVDPIEERRKVRAAVNQNVVSFVVVCAAIRIGLSLLHSQVSDSSGLVAGMSNLLHILLHPSNAWKFERNSLILFSFQLHFS